MDYRNFSVFNTGLSRRVANALYRRGIRDLQTLAQTPVEELLRIYGIGATAIDEITSLLASYGCQVTTGDVEFDTNSETPDPIVFQTSFPPEQSVMDLPVSNRTRRALYRSGIRTVADLLSATREELATLGGLGEISLQELDTYFRLLRTANLEDNDYGQTDNELHVVPHHESELDLSQVSEQDVFEALMLGINERNVEILAYRFGLLGNEVHTLQETGDKFGLTRERVRQVCVNNIRTRVRRSTQQNRLLRHIRALCKQYIEDASVTTIEKLVTYVADAIATQDADQLVGLLRFINDEVLDDDQQRFGLTVEKTLICDTKLGADYVLSVYLAIRNYLNTNMAPMSLTKLFEFTNRQFADNPPDQKIVCGILELHPDFGQMDNGDWGLHRWRKKLFDDMVIVLRELGRPAHFTELTSLVNQRLATDEQVTPHTVHAQLGRYTNLFIRTDSGTFALRQQFPDAPVQPPKYVDLIEEVLDEAGVPLDVNTVHERVNPLREAKFSSIMIYLGTHEKFTSYGGGLYGLAKWRHDERILTERGELTFSYCPPPLLPSRGNARVFFDSLLVGRRLLIEKQGLLPREFYGEMLSWAEQAPTRERDVQSAFDAWYAAGLIPPINIADPNPQPLQLMIAADMKLQHVRMQALSSICRRVMKTSELLSVLDSLPSADTKTLKAIVFSGTSDGLDISLRLNMLAAFEAVRVDGSNWRITDVGRAALQANPPQELPDFSVIETLEPEDSEVDDWDDHLEMFML